MTMMMTNSQFGLEDMEDLLWESSSPMADTVDFRSDYSDQQEPQEGGRASPEWDTPPSTSSTPPFYSPLAGLFQGDKVGTESDWLSLPSAARLGQLRQVALDDRKEDMLNDPDWMAKWMDLGAFDLESLIGSYSTNKSSSSPEDFLAPLDCSMELDSLPLPASSTPMTTCSPASSTPTAHTLTPIPPSTTTSSVIMVEDPKTCIEDRDVLSPPPCVPEPQEELEISSEPASPGLTSPVSDSPPSPAYGLDLGSEVDVSASELGQGVSSVAPPVQRVVLSLSPTRLVFVLAPKKEVVLSAPIITSTPEVIRVCAPQKPCRSRPYPDPTACPHFPSGSGKVRQTVKSKGKKLKKMEQNKTAATRYRQKKKLEKDGLLEEHSILERRNVDLKEKVKSIAREIEYLKELMEEVRQTRMKKGLAADP